MLETLRTPIGRGIVAVAATLLLFGLVLWLAADAIAILPVLIVPIWLGFFATDQPVDPRRRRLLFVTLGAGIALFLVAVFAFIVAS